MTPLQLPSPAPPFDDRLFALSRISHRLAYPSPFKHPSQQQKHLKLLDLLALLLVTEPNGDVAATTFIRTTGQITVLFSKNRPCNQLEKSYVQSIHEIITSTTGEATSLQDALQQLLELVIGNCSRKIKARLNKLVNRLKSLSIGDVVKPLPPHITLRLWNLLKPTGFPSPSSVPLERSISHWLKSLLQAPVRALAGIQATTTLFVAYCIGHMEGTDPLIDDPILFRRLRKLGDYYAAVRCLVKSYSELKPSDSIVFREIISPYPESKTLESDVIGTLNSWASHRSHQPPTVESLLPAYPTLAGASTPGLSLLFGDTLWATSPDRLLTHTVTASVHAECNLLLYLTTLNLPAIEFGASKNVCWMCGCYIISLNDHYPGKIHFSGRQGKVHAGWQFPEHTPVMVREKVECYLAHELDIVLTRVARERRLDSEPRGSDNEEDEEWQEVKVGEFPEGFWAVGE